MQKKIQRSVILSFLFLAFTILLVVYPNTSFSKKVYYRTFQNTLQKKIEQAGHYTRKLWDSNFEGAMDYSKKFNQKGIVILIYENDSIFFWSDNSINIPKQADKFLLSEYLVELDNSLFYQIIKSKEERKIVSLIRLQNSFSYHNEFLISGILPEFGVPPGSTVLKESDKHGICNENGEILFDLQLAQSNLKYGNQLVATASLFISLICFLFFLYYVIGSIQNYSRRLWGFALISAAILTIRVLLIVFGISPTMLYAFDPFTYASYVAPTLGDQMVNAMLNFWFAITLYNTIKINCVKGNWRKTLLAIMAFGVILFFQYVFSIVHSLTEHSNINLVVHQFNDITLEVFIAYIIILVNYLSLGFVMLCVQDSFYPYINIKQQLVLFLLALIVAIPVAFLFGIAWQLWFLALPLLFYFALLVIREKVKSAFYISYLLPVVFAITLIIQFTNIYFAHKKEKKQLVTIANDLANEHDPIAEYLFIDFTNKIKNDTVINEGITGKEITNYIQKEYLKGYWRKYNLSYISVCDPDFYFYDKTNLNWHHCYSFYDSLIQNLGVNIPGSNFYYLKNYNGNISYLGYFNLNGSIGLNKKLFIELDSKPASEMLGYPELLLNQRLKTKSIRSKYHYAKYHNGRLITQSGNYNYSLRDKEFGKDKNGIVTYRLIDERFFQHLAYYPDNNSVVVVTRDKLKFIDYAVVFSYLFIFLFIVVFIFLGFSQFDMLQFRKVSDFRGKMQLATISILVFSMVAVGVSTIAVLIGNHNQNQRDILEEKIQSVYIELVHKLSYEENLDKTWSSSKYESLNQLLIKFSDVFYSDINLYTPNGMLLATSREELFNKGLKGEIMNPAAYYNMHTKQKKQFIHKERIYRLKYMSAYIPFTNNEGKLLAYLNLPYFTKQTDLQAGITQLSVTIINIYLLLMIITLLVAYIISNQLTRPIEMLRHKLSGLKIGVAYDKIDYQRNDEIGKLVEQYNSTVAELEHSVGLLAKSERESAWREMAKQIAHEIKNPLTPMRLSVQQLKRAWDDNSESFETYLNRTIDTLIEQIDSLSSIATEFSNFAKIPAAQIQTIDLLKIIDKAIQLFSSSDDCVIKGKYRVPKVMLNADPEQLLRVFINLIKNAIQAIPANRQGIITINVEQIDNAVQVAITDNGKGIPEKLIPKLFQPNFTTKSGGTGIGLAIVKNVLNGLNADIQIESKFGRGSTFYITFYETK